MKNIISAALAVCLVASPVQAREFAVDDGNDLLSTCNSGEYYNQGYCLGYIRGLSLGVDAVLETGKKKICYPENVTMGQLRDVVIAYIRRNPAERNKNAMVLVAFASSDAWPCQ